MPSSVSVYLPDHGYTYRFSGVLSVKHELSLKIQQDGESLYHTDYVNGARNAPNRLILQVLESDVGHPAGWSTRMLQAMESVKRNRCVCVVTTPAFVYAGMLLSEIAATVDETSPSGWQGTLTFTQYAPAAGTKLNDNSSSTTHVGSVGSALFLSGEALLSELRRAGVLE